MKALPLWTGLDALRDALRFGGALRLPRTPTHAQRRRVADGEVRAGNLRVVAGGERRELTEAGRELMETERTWRAT